MWTVTLVKFRHRPSKPDTDAFAKHLKSWASKGVKLHMVFYTLGRYDAVFIGEGPGEKSAMRFTKGLPEVAATETLVAVQCEETIKWLG
jgi:uncharacterized protein with GYD domain